VGDLETLEAVTALSLTADNIENLIDQLGTLGVVTLGPVVSGTGLTEDEVVRSEELTEWASTDGVHGTRLQVDKDGTRDVLVASTLRVLSQQTARDQAFDQGRAGSSLIPR
jgi:hypothetical protein